MRNQTVSKFGALAMAGALAASTLVIGGAAPQVAKVSAATAAVNDNWADAIDVSTLAVPPFDGSFTGVQVAGTTVGSTIEAGEPPVIDGFGNPWPMGTVWYRYESPPGGFSGLLGYRMTDSSFIVNAYAAYEPDPFNPFLGLYPDEGPGALDRMAAAPAYVVRRDLPGGLFYEAPVVRVEPGQKVWFQVVPNPSFAGAAPGEFTFELYHVDDVTERVGGAAEAYACGAACGPLSNFSSAGYADTWAASPQPLGAASSWMTFEVAAQGTFAVTVSSQKASRRESPRPVDVAVYRAPTSARVTDPGELGAPVASAAGGLVPVTTWLNGQFTTVQQWVTEVTNVAVTPGRYYVRISGDATFTGYQARLVSSVAVPPTVAITSPTANAVYSAASVPALAFYCLPNSGVVGTTVVVVDGTTVAATDPLPTTLGTHTISVTCTNTAGASATATTSYSVATPPTVTITSPPAGAMYWLPSDVPALAFTCTPTSGTVAATVVVADGATLAATDPLPSTPGAHSITVTCTDSSGLSATATTSYSVADPLRVPDRTLTTPEDVAGQLDLVTPIVTPPGVTVTVESVSSPANGTVSAGSAGVTYTPAANYVGPDSFTYTVVGSNGQRATGTVAVTVTPVNDAPVAVDDALAVDARASLEIDFVRLVANDTDIDGGTLSITSITRAGGTVTGRLTSCTGTRPACQLYVAPQSAGTESFDYVVSDGNGGTDTGRLTITVRPIGLPDYLFVSMPCDNINVSGATTGIRITRQFGVILVRGLALLGSQSAWFNVIGFERGGFAYGWVFFGNGNNSRTLVPQSITNPIGDTWIITGTYRIGRQVCPFQINVVDGG